MADLARYRRDKGISLGEIAESTRIPIRYLDAIEQGKYSNLPGGTYNISYIRQYARAVGYNETELVKYYCDTTGYELNGPNEGEPEPKPEPLPTPAQMPAKPVASLSLTGWIASRLLPNSGNRKPPKK